MNKKKKKIMIERRGADICTIIKEDIEKDE
jgi:hypothetical protein